MGQVTLGYLNSSSLSANGLPLALGVLGCLPERRIAFVTNPFPPTVTESVSRL
jgi:hypothetical protein